MTLAVYPNLKKALRDCKPLQFFAEIWLSVLNAAVDSQADWEASKTLTNIDTTTKEGFATIALQSASIAQSQSGSLLKTGPEEDNIGWQSITLDRGYYIGDFSFLVDSSSVTTGSVTIYDSTKATAYYTVAFDVANAASQALTVNFNNVYLAAGTYFFAIKHTGSSSVYFEVHYTTSNVYSGGQLDYYFEVVIPFVGTTYIWAYDIGDLYFSLTLYKYKASATVRTKRIDLGRTPTHAVFFQMALSQPVGTSVTAALDLYSDDSTETPAVSYTDISDGAEVAQYRYAEIELVLNANTDLDAAPTVDMAELLSPSDILYLRENVKLEYMDAGILNKYRPMLEPLKWTTSKLNTLDRVSSGGEAKAVLRDPSGELISRIVSGYPLANSRAILYVGADVPGFKEADLFRYFIGTVKTAKIKPRYRREYAALPLTFKNSIQELTRKVPVPASSGYISASETSINYDGAHCLDASLGMMRDHGMIPARYIDVNSFESEKTNIPNRLVRRSNNSKYRAYQVISITPNSNAGSGTVDDVTVNGSAMPGVYTAETADGTNFSVENPLGSALGTAVIDTAFSSEEISFTIASGDTAYSADDSFDIEIGVPDTSITSQEEVRTHLKPLCYVANGYIVLDDNGKVKFIRHNIAAAAVATWANESLVKAGITAVPIEDIGDIDLGYDTLLYNCAIAGNAWDGSGSDWTAVQSTYAYINQDSADDFAPGASEYISVFEKPLLEASKWLGAETGYNGETIAREMTEEIVDRYAYPPIVLTGVVVPLSEFTRQVGDIIQIWDTEIAWYLQRGILTSEVFKFMITGKDVDRDKNRMVFDLIQLK